MSVLIRGGGDLASGVALRLRRAGMPVIVTELPNPLAVRRAVAFSEAIRAGTVTIEGQVGTLIAEAGDTAQIRATLTAGQIAVLIDPEAHTIRRLKPAAVVDARLLKQVVSRPADPVALLIGLGPGFTPGVNCQAAVETARGPALGRVYWDQPASADTGQPDPVMAQTGTRVLRAPATGVLTSRARIGAVVEAGELIAEVAGRPLHAAFRGALRGLLPTGMPVTAGLKIGDLDPRAEAGLCFQVSDKALAMGGAVLEALLTRAEVRAHLWD
ncbi:MAG: EF2563 family selenium-dependent molybdenum hydroxylase system protein [Anaerolineales bacterium]|nr:EF2563 family selenium-dependent molybdenum hydroxylase system protein [Anaerolineales bacterium]